MRLIIDYPDDMLPSDAITLVKCVVAEGRVSETQKGVKHFCWLTRFANGNTVLSRRKSTAKSADSFRIDR